MTGNPDLPAEKWLAQQLAEIRSEIAELRGARAAGFSNIAQGALTITDENGIVRTRVGLLSDGDYGVEVDSPAGVPISVGGSLFGLQAFQAAGFVPLTALATQDVGPSQVVAVPASDRLLVVMFAILSAQTNATNPTTAYATAYALVDGHIKPPALEARVVGTAAGQGLSEVSVAAFEIFDDLGPGDHTFSIGAQANSFPVANIQIGPRGFVFLPL